MLCKHRDSWNPFLSNVLMFPCFHILFLSSCLSLINILFSIISIPSFIYSLLLFSLFSCLPSSLFLSLPVFLLGGGHILHSLASTLLCDHSEYCLEADHCLAILCVPHANEPAGSASFLLQHSAFPHFHCLLASPSPLHPLADASWGSS